MATKASKLVENKTMTKSSNGYLIDLTSDTVQVMAVNTSVVPPRQPTTLNGPVVKPEGTNGISMAPTIPTGPQFHPTGPRFPTSRRVPSARHLPGRRFPTGRKTTTGPKFKTTRVEAAKQGKENGKKAEAANGKMKVKNKEKSLKKALAKRKASESEMLKSAVQEARFTIVKSTFKDDKTFLTVQV